MDLNLEKQQMHTGFEFTGFPTNLGYYRNTCLSIVSENSFTQDRGTPYLTEKLFRCIVNHHPFILLGDYGINEYVESLGYKTYNKFFLPFTESIQSDTYKIIEWASKSVKHFIDNKHNHIDEIREITEHNFNVFMSDSKKELDKLLSMFPNLNLDDPDLFGPL
jgi:hypothetical protein